MVDYDSTTVQFNLAGQKWQTDLLKAYPLPAATEDQCRDAFLKELLEPYQASSTSSVTLESDDSLGEQQDDLSGSLNLEAKFFHRMTIRKTHARRTDKSMLESRISRIEAPDIFQLMKGRLGRVTSALGYLFTVMGLTDVKDALKLVYESCRLNVTVDKSFNMFSWSTEHYFTRFNLSNPTYLDVIGKQLNQHLNHYKFLMDVSEIMRLFTAIDDDVRSKRDICEHSMMLIKDAEIDVKQVVSTFLKLSEQEHRNVVFSAIAVAGRSADPGNIQKNAVYTKINHDDFEFPIEARYRYNWAQAQQDQADIITKRYIEQTRNELKKVAEEYEESDFLWECSQIAYDVEIKDLKYRIQQVEKAYENNIQFLENEENTLRKNLTDAKEELLNCRARVEMFHVRIEEMLRFFAQQKTESKPQLAAEQMPHKTKKKSLRGAKKKSGKKTTRKKKTVATKK